MNMDIDEIDLCLAALMLWHEGVVESIETDRLISTQARRCCRYCRPRIDVLMERMKQYRADLEKGDA